MKRRVLLLPVLLLGCGGGGSSSSVTNPENASLASGPWELQIPILETLLDFNLSQTGNQIGAVGSTSCFNYGVNQPPYSGPGGLEDVSTSGMPSCSSISGSVSGDNVTLSWGQLTFQGAVNQDGSISGTTSNDGPKAPFTAKPVSSLPPNGTYSGTFSAGFVGNVVLAINREANYQIAALITMDGAGPYNLVGQLIGNVLLLSGTVAGNTPVYFEMYYDVSGRVTGVANSITVFDLSTEPPATYFGQLTLQE
jgi:hypothetical protein